MGLFSNSKKLCPFCGNATPLLGAVKIEGVPVCKSCEEKIDLPKEKRDGMTIEQMGEYFAFYEENRALAAQFTETWKYDTSTFTGSAFVFDGEHRLLRFSEKPGKLVFPAECVTLVTVSEDSAPLFSLSAEGLCTFETDTPSLARQMESIIAQFRMEYRRYEERKRIQNMQAKKQGDKPAPELKAPVFEADPPFRNFRIEVKMNHPWQDAYSYNLSGPSFSCSSPSVAEYLREYDRKREQLYNLLCAFRDVCFPGTPEDKPAASVPAEEAEQPSPAEEQPAAPAEAGIESAAAPALGAADELLKYKQLLDAGALTQEEFDAVKKQLLGL